MSLRIAVAILTILSVGPLCAEVSHHCDGLEQTDESLMVWIDGGVFTMGSDDFYPEERPAREVEVDGFWIDRTEVTNAQFAEFVNATEYVTLAERITDVPAGSAMFVSPADGESGWWRYIEGANWRHPEGPDSDIDGREQHPVVHVAYEDALAYAEWKGHSIPTESQWEFAAGGQLGPESANTWQGFFPFKNSAEDGYEGSSPVGCYEANRHGLYDMVGNVWELTSTEVAPRPGVGPSVVIKGGSFLCAPNYCRRYRASARQTQEMNLGTSHVGFRTVRTKKD